MLMEEEPRALEAYLRAIYPRRIRDRRLADFQQAFGSDLVKLERRYLDYIATQVKASTSPLTLPSPPAAGGEGRVRGRY
jgi:hypothetical protein